MTLAFGAMLGQAARGVQERWVRRDSPAGRALALRRLLEVNPRPLLNPDARMMLIFSPKAACSNVAIWFFHHLGHGEKARELDRWPHAYRQQVYYNSELYRDAAASDLSGYKVVRVIRDPYDRAASAFRHGIRTLLAEREIAPVLNRPDIAKAGLSFDDYLTFLERLDLDNCNPHFKVQHHPIEDLLPVDHLINVSTQDLFARLAEVASALGLPPATPHMQEWVDELSYHNRPAAVLPDAPNMSAMPFTRRQALKGPWPASSSLLTPRARERLNKLYAVDIRSYLEDAGA